MLVEGDSGVVGSTTARELRHFLGSVIIRHVCYNIHPTLIITTSLTLSNLRYIIEHHITMHHITLPSYLILERSLSLLQLFLHFLNSLPIKLKRELARTVD